MDKGPWVAIDASTDRRRRARELARVHDEVVGGGSASDRLRNSIASSWERSASAGVDPTAGTAPLPLGRDGAALRWVEHPLSAAEPVLRRLLADVRSDDAQVVLVCDADGTLLWIDGEPAVLDAAQEINLEPGALWSEAAAGTNAMGTALAIDHPIQVFSAEHFARPVHGWTCSAAPVDDPETGRRLGVIDLSGEIATAHPHSLALIEAAAQMTQAELHRQMSDRHARLRERWGERLSASGATALLSPAGTVVAARRGDWIGRRFAVPPGGGPVRLRGAPGALAEPLGEEDAHLLWVAGAKPVATDAVTPGLRIEALGRDRARVEAGGTAHELSPRHSELIALLSLTGDELDASRLQHELYGDHASPVTLRAELSRLRRALGDHLPRGGHRLEGAVETDFGRVEELLAAGEIAAALDAYPGPLLPGSRVPLLVERRERIDHGLREAALRSGDGRILSLWLDCPSGRDDEIACRALLERLPNDDPRRPAMLSRLRRLVVSDPSV